MKFPMKYNEKGSILVEFLVVILVVGILTGIVLNLLDPNSHYEKVEDVELTSTINNIAIATE